MNDIFISYASVDREKAKIFALAFSEKGWSVFWDQHIAIHEQFTDVLQRELDNAKCVVVLWSQEAVKSQWVKEEALAAAQRKVLYPVLIDDIEIPFGFRSIQTIQMLGWHGDVSHPNFKRLTTDLAKAIGNRKPIISISKPNPSDPITDEHLVLIHSSWRVAHRDAEFDNREMYQIHIIVFGDPAALDRIELVTFYLDPAYPNPIRSNTNRKFNFELKELANGYSKIRADISIKNQVELVHLSRFINLTESGPRLESEFMR